VKPWITPADGLTALRVPLAAAFPFLHRPGARLAVLAVVTASDVFDGVLARRFGGSRMGAVLDPIADKLFMLAAFWTVWRSGILLWWEIVGVLLRDVIAAVGGATVWLLHRPVALPARAGGKAVTVCQVLTLVAFVAESPLVRPLAWATAAISFYALWDYGRAAARVTEGM
jgi:phosphatidylglycerophosphate synthase